MKRYLMRMLCITVAAALVVAAAPSILRAASESGEHMDEARPDTPVTAGDSQADPGSRLNRIDFGNTYIIGQTIKSGAVYLLQRKKSEIKSMLEYREDYREEILDGFTVDDGEAREGNRKEDPDREKKVSMKGGGDPAETGVGQ